MTSQSSQWGRVADDGTVYVRLGDEEQAVGQYPEGTPEEALAFFTRRFEGLEFEVQLLEQRIHSGTVGPDEAVKSVDQIAEQLATPNAVGDILGLRGRLEALRPVISQQRAQRKQDRQRRTQEARARKLEIVTTAEQIATGTDWRNGANRMRELLADWKSLPRLDKATDDELWHRFSTARTAYTKARKAHFAEQDQRRTAAKTIKERLIREAEELQNSTDWGPTSARYRQLMSEWKAAGPAPREVDEQLWRQFRAAQDVFFSARDAANSAQNEEFAANAEVKKKLAAEAEALLPVTDLEAAKKAFRDIAERWDAAGKVPRDQLGTLEGRMRKVERAIREVEDEQWRRTDPEKSARADDLVGKLQEAIDEVQAKLDKAHAAGDDRQVAKLEKELDSRRAFLEAAQRAAADFS